MVCPREILTCPRLADMADFRLITHSTVDTLTVGVVPTLALKEDLKERKHLTRPTVIDPQVRLPYKHAHVDAHAHAHASAQTSTRVRAHPTWLTRHRCFVTC